MKFKRALQTIALCCGLAGFGSSNAAVMLFDGVSDTGSILYSGSQDGATLSALVEFTLNSLSASQAIFGVKVSNNSSGWGDNRLTSFAIDVVNPKLSYASANNGWDASLSANFPSFGKVDLCLWDGSNCSGGASGGVGEGAVESFVLTLKTTGNFLTSGIEFTSPYAVKFQSVGFWRDSIEIAGSIVGAPNGGGSSQVPEPASIALAGLGLLGAALVRRRKA